MDFSIENILNLLGTSCLVFIGLVLFRFLIYIYNAALAVAKFRYLLTKHVVDIAKDETTELGKKLAAKAPVEEVNPLVEKIVDDFSESHKNFVRKPSEFIMYMSRWTINSTINKEYHQELKDKGIYYM